MRLGGLLTKQLNMSKTPEEKNELTMHPGDYFIPAGNVLKIENVSKDMVITVDLPTSYTVEPLKVDYQEGKK